MTDLPGYDAWKLATPPEYEREESEEDQGAPSALCTRCNRRPRYVHHLIATHLCWECNLVWRVEDEDISW